MKYYVDYDRGNDYHEEWKTRVSSSREDALMFCNSLQKGNPDCNFRIIHGKELEVVAKEKITEYVYK